MVIEMKVVGLDVAKNVFQVHVLIVAVKQFCVSGFGDHKLLSSSDTKLLV